MSDPSPPPPRYPDVTAADWERVAALVLLLVRKRAGDRHGPPEDIVREAVRRAQDPTYKEWDRVKYTLPRYVGSIANSLIANADRKLEASTTRRFKEGELDYLEGPSENPHDVYTEAEADAIMSARLVKVRERVSDDGCCVALLDAVLRGDDKPRKRAEAAGFTYRQVELAREKVARAATKVAEEEARVSKKKGYDR